MTTATAKPEVLVVDAADHSATLDELAEWERRNGIEVRHRGERPSLLRELLTERRE